MGELVHEICLFWFLVGLMEYFLQVYYFKYLGEIVFSRHKLSYFPNWHELGRAIFFAFTPSHSLKVLLIACRALIRGGVEWRAMNALWHYRQLQKVAIPSNGEDCMTA